MNGKVYRMYDGIANTIQLLCRGIEKECWLEKERSVGEILRDLARQKKIDVLEGHLMPDHFHMCLKIPPKYSVTFALGLMKGKSVEKIHRKAGYKKVTGMHFWSRGYCVNTVGLDEETINKYIREQKKQEKKQLDLFE